MNFNSWRDCHEWKSQGLSLNTQSNEAAKLYDVTLSQLIGWYENMQYGGLENSMKNMLRADPNFVLGHCLKNGINLIGSSVSQSFHDESIKELVDIANKYSNILTEREKCHVEAIKYLHEGDLDKACFVWENILIEHPTDIMAVKFSHDTYFYLGNHAQMRDSLSRIIPKWNASLPYYSYLHGMHSFGLVQTNFCDKARNAALKSLEMNRNDAWATHSLCHFYEYNNDFETGIKFLRDTEKDWSVCDLLATHNYWHLAVYHIEKDEHQEALNIFDQNTSTHLKHNRTLDMVDLISMLFRLKLDCCQIDLKDKWSSLRDVYVSRVNDHGYTFNDAHIMIMLSELNDEKNMQAFFKSLDDYLEESNLANKDLNENCLINNFKHENNSNYLKTINKQLAPKIFSSICYFNQGEYAKVIDTLYPVRYELIKIGGSNAQRDLFHQMMVQSALRSENKFHKKLGLALLNERFDLKPYSNLNQRIATRFADNHHH